MFLVVAVQITNIHFRYLKLYSDWLFSQQAYILGLTLVRDIVNLVPLFSILPEPRH
jgi:hypothetical protein